jgi:hypothetical protein
MSAEEQGAGTQVAPMPYGKNIQPRSKTDGERALGSCIGEAFGRMALGQ